MIWTEFSSRLQGKTTNPLVYLALILAAILELQCNSEGVVAPSDGNVDSSGEVMLIVPDQISVGDDMPLVVKGLDGSGHMRSSLSGSFAVEAGGEVLGDLEIKKGMGSISAPMLAQGAMEVAVLGLAGTAKVQVVEAWPQQQHAGSVGPGQVVWDAAFEHFISDDLTVPEGAILIVDQGARVVVDVGVNIVVRGSIQVEGTRERPVVFTAARCGQAWGGIELINASGQFTHCFLTQGGGDASKVFGHSDSQPVLMARESELSIRAGYFIDNPGKALGAEQSRVVVEASLISRCDTGGNSVLA